MLNAIGIFVIRHKYAVVVAWFVVILVAAPFFTQAANLLKPGGFSNESFPSVQAR